MTSGWLAAFAVQGAGALLAWLGLRAGGLRGGRLARYTAGFGPGLGLGLASLLVFFVRTVGGAGMRPPGLAAFLLTAAGLAAVIVAWPRLRRSRAGAAERASGAEPEAPSPPSAPRLPLAVRLGAWLLFAASAAAVLVSFWVIRETWPNGTWDAVAIWNVKARALFRGYDQAPDFLKQVDPSSHPNYPLLLPGAVAAQWSMAGGEDPWTAPLTGLAFLAGLGLLTLAVAADSGLLAFGAVAAALLWGNPMVLKWGSGQGADLAVAYCFLGALAVLASRLPGRAGAPGSQDDGLALPPFLGGIFLGLLAWSKNEGTLMVLILLGLYALWALRHGRGRPAVWRDAVPIAAGALPGFAAVFLFKGLWAPESGLDTFFQGHPLDRVLSLERWFIPVREIVKRLIPWGPGLGWGVSWPLVLGGALLAAWMFLRERRPWASFWAAAVGATVASWVPIFAVTPYGQMWHIQGSLDRLYLQVFPVLVAGVCLRLGMVLAADPGQERFRWEGRSRRPLSVPVWLAGLLALGLAVKTFVVASWLPRMWLFLDELFYLVTAWDLSHWRGLGVPHPDFLFYPPLTSALLAPILALGVSPPTAYHAGLLLFHVLLTSSVVAAWLIGRRLFGESSRLLAGLLVFGPPAYAALMLMSEPVFVALYTWSLYFWVRTLQERRTRDAWTVGLLLAGLVLTRFAGYLAVGSLALAVAGGWAVSWLRRNPWTREDRRLLRLHLLLLAVPAATAVLWRLAGAALRTESTPQTFYLLAIVVNFPLELALGAARRLMAEIGYVSLSTYGFALPAALWGLWRGRLLGERPREVRLLTASVLIFLVAAGGLAAVFMWFAHFLSYLPRFDLYGRYVEYFAIPLLVVAFGVFASMRRQSSARERLALAAAALALNALFLLFVPAPFFTASLEGQIAPNSLGIAWLIRLVGEAGLWSRWLAPVLSAALVWGLTAGTGGRRAAGGVLVALTLVNFVLGVREVSYNSMGSAAYNSQISEAVSASPETFAKGLYVDYPDYRREVGEDAVGFVQVYRVIADHVDKVVVGTEPESYLGRMPVLTKRSFDRPVLAQWPGLPYRIYAADPVPVSPSR